MTQPPTPPSETLDELLAETRRYAGYLDKLEERREGTPPQLFSRLREEYETRLADLRLRAEVEAEALADGLAEDEAAVQDAEARLIAVEEERAEGELRAAVGELDSRVWAKRLNGLNAQVTSIGAERDALVAALAHRRALLEEVQGQRGAAVVSELPPRVSFASPAFGGEVPESPLPRATRTVGAQGLPPVPPAAPVATGAMAAAGGLFDDLDLLRPTESSPVATASLPEQTEPMDHGGSDAKSLKCHDCGTFNFPTEWYCERCGGELAAD
ncbi:MAG: hypothetical protein RL625_1535 [Gemmatimonadota bacterium]